MKQYIYMFVFMLAFLTILAERNGFHSLIDMLIWSWGVDPFFKVTLSLFGITLGILVIMLAVIVIRKLKEAKSSHEN